MKIFTRKTSKDDAAEVVERMAQTEIDRREFCIQQAVMLDESSKGQGLIALAEKIYAYVYGERK